MLMVLEIILSAFFACIFWAVGGAITYHIVANLFPREVEKREDRRLLLMVWPLAYICVPFMLLCQFISYLYIALIGKDMD